MRWTCSLCPAWEATTGDLLAHVRAQHPEHDTPDEWPHGVQVQTWVGDELTHDKAWRREDWR